MKCPNCDQLLQITERYHIEIDYCPVCRGVWLDKGELDKMIGLSNQQLTVPSGKPGKQDPHYSESDNKHYQNKYNKKKSFLGDLFDF